MKGRQELGCLPGALVEEELGHYPMFLTGSDVMATHESQTVGHQKE